MDPVSNVDRIILLLRQRLQERARTQAGRGQTSQNPPPASAVQALAGVEGIDERRFRRALIQNLLAERLGAGLINDANFQQVVDRVAQTIESDPELSRLLQTVSRELRSAAG